MKLLLLMLFMSLSLVSGWHPISKHNRQTADCKKACGHHCGCVSVEEVNEQNRQCIEDCETKLVQGAERFKCLVHGCIMTHGSMVHCCSVCQFKCDTKQVEGCARYCASDCAGPYEKACFQLCLDKTENLRVECDAKASTRRCCGADIEEEKSYIEWNF